MPSMLLKVGDEVNVIQPEKNYGWPVVSFGRTYEGSRVSEIPWHALLRIEPEP